MIKKIILIILFVFFISTAFAKSGVNIFSYPRNVPNTKIFNQYGQSIELKDFKGNFLIVIFWSKTCIPCIREIDEINEFVNKTKGTGIKLITVSPEKEWIYPEEQKSFLKRYGGKDIEFYSDRKSALANGFGIFSSPHTVLISPDSMEIGRIRGAVDWADSNVIEYMYKLKSNY